MQIIFKTEGMSLKEVVSLTMGNDVKKMSDAVGEVLDFDKVVIYEDVNSKDEPMQVLAVQTAEGVKYATNSATFIRNYTEIMGIFKDSDEEAPTTFKVGSGKSKAGRPFITCDIANATQPTTQVSGWATPSIVSSYTTGHIRL